MNTTLNLALEALHEKLALPMEHIILKEDNTHSIVQIMDVDFLCEVKDSVTTANVGDIANRLKTLSTIEKRPVLLIAKYITPTVIGDLATNGVNSLDCAGNCHIKYEKECNILFYLVNKGEKNTWKAEKPYPAFHEAGLKVIFFLLQNPLNANKPYREIQNETGVSLGAIKNVLDELIKRNFILLASGKRILKNKNTLLNLWIENYNQVLKPKLLLGKMSFRTNAQREHWAALNLPKGMYWGGEGGANKIDDYLEPGAFDIYTDIPVANLLRTGMVMQNKNGDIRIYQKFWKWETDNQLAPLILIYADLMGSGNNRCQEMAKRLLDHGLEDYK